MIFFIKLYRAEKNIKEENEGNSGTRIIELPNRKQRNRIRAQRKS